MSELQISEAMKNTLRAIHKLTKADQAVTQDRIAEEMGRSDSAAAIHLKRAQELGLVTKSIRKGRVVPGSYRLTTKGARAASQRK